MSRKRYRLVGIRRCTYLGRSLRDPGTRAAAFPLDVNLTRFSQAVPQVPTDCTLFRHSTLACDAAEGQSELSQCRACGVAFIVRGANTGPGRMLQHVARSLGHRLCLSGHTRAMHRPNPRVSRSRRVSLVSSCGKAAGPPARLERTRSAWCSGKGSRSVIGRIDARSLALCFSWPGHVTNNDTIPVDPCSA